MLSRCCIDKVVIVLQLQLVRMNIRHRTVSVFEKLEIVMEVKDQL